MIENSLSGVLGALVGVLIGHQLARALYRERAKYIEKAFYKEFEIVRDDLIHWFPSLVDEHASPLRDNYSGPAPLDLKLLGSLVVELAGTDKIVSPDQRMLLSRLERMIDNIRRNDGMRDIHIKKWIESGNEADKSERFRIGSAISFITCQLLLDSAQGIYFLNKVVNEKKKFAIGEYSSVLVFFEQACALCGIEFRKEQWSPIIERLGIN